MLATVSAADDGDDKECKAEDGSLFGPCDGRSQNLGHAAAIGGDDDSSTLGSCDEVIKILGWLMPL